MSARRKAIIAIVVVVILGSAAALSFAQRGDRGVRVRMEEVARRDLVATVTASGNIRARRTVDISSDVAGRIIELNIDEGQDVTQGQILLRLDPTQFQAAVARARATLSQAQATGAERQASLLQAQRQAERLATIRSRDSTLISLQQVQDAETDADVAQALQEAAEHGVAQARASLDEAQDRLSKTTIRAPISGKVTRLNVELGETVIVGTMNNPGSLILTISDLSVIEAVMEVDETDVPEIAIGDSALVELDAFPDRRFKGSVTEIGNSAIQDPSTVAGTGQTPTIDFEVVITLDEPPAELRPDLSASADIITDTRDGALSVPIIALTVREPDEAEDDLAADTAAPGRPEGPLARALAGEPEEGVFVVRDGTVTFTPVEVGIVGQEHIEVISGISEGDTVVSGPYQIIRELEDGEAVRPMERRASEE